MNFTKYIVFLTCIFFLACNEHKKEKDNMIHYKTMIVKACDMTLNQEYNAVLTGRQIVEIRPQVAGNITQICINEGDKVRKGQTLFIIDQVPYQAALEMAVATRQSAEAKLATARMNYNSERKLKEGNVVSDFSVETTQNALLEAEATLRQAKAQETNARNSLSYTVVKSPVNGVASMIPWHVGSLVSSSISEPLVTVSDDNEMYAYFSITENLMLDMIDHYGSAEDFIKKAPPVSMLLSNGKTYTYEGHIDAISGTVDSHTGAVTLRATFQNPEHLLLNSGMATVVVPTHLENCIVVPQSAVYELQNRTFVYQVIDGKTKSKAIEVYHQNNGREYVVEKGLEVGDTIVAEGAGLVKEGVEVTIEKR